MSSLELLSTLISDAFAKLGTPARMPTAINAIAQSRMCEVLIDLDPFDQLAQVEFRLGWRAIPGRGGKNFGDAVMNTKSYFRALLIHCLPRNRSHPLRALYRNA